MDEDIVMLFGDGDFEDEDFSDDDFEEVEEEEAWEVNKNWLMALVTPPSLPGCSHQVSTRLELVKKVIHVSDAEVAAGVSIGEIGPRVFAIEVDASVMDIEEDLAALFGEDDDSEGFDEEEVWEVNKEWLMAPVTPPSVPAMQLSSLYEVGGLSTVAAEGPSFPLPALGLPIPPSVIEDLSTRLGNLEYEHGQLVKKVVQVSDAEVAVGVSIGEIGPRVFAMEGQMQRCSRETRMIQQLQTTVSEMGSRESTLMQCILGMDRRLAALERRPPEPQKYRVSDLSSCIGSELDSELTSLAGSELGIELTSLAGSELSLASYRLIDDYFPETCEQELCPLNFFLASCQVSSNELSLSSYSEDGNPAGANIKQALANELTDAFGKPFEVLNNILSTLTWVFNSLVHSSRALSALRRSGLRTASTAAKPCQGDSSKFYLITGSIHTDQQGTVVLATLFNESEQRHFRSFITNINLQESRRLQLLAKKDVNS
nr:hypothetical protein [Tanacetum cinerariifolium]